MAEQSDNTRVVVKYPILSEQSKLVPRKQDQLYDADKTKYYQNLQNFYNNNIFGYGVFGNQTRYDPHKEREQIKSNFDYSRNNAINFTTSLLPTGVAGYSKSILPTTRKEGVIDNLSSLLPYKIGEGAEAIVISNSPTTVGKIAQVSSKDLLRRNAIPNSEPLKFIGYVKDGAKKFPAFIQKKLKILNEETFPKYVDKLDKAMEKSGFRKINDPNVQYRAYTNGTVVIDDVAPGNVGVTLFKKPKLIDFNLQSVPEWLEEGFILKKGGKLNLNNF